jgi:WD40 repeat protein
MQLPTDPELSLLLATEAVRTASTSEALDALRQGIRDSRLRMAMRGHRAAIVSATFSRDGSRIVTTSADGTARIWDARTSALSVELTGHRGGVSAVDVSPDGRLVATASDDNTGQVWDATTGRPIAELRGHGRSEEGVVGSRFSPNGRSVVTAAADRTAMVWDPSTGRAIVVLRGHEAEVWSAAFSPDGSRILTASADRTTRVWDAATGAPVQVLTGHSADLTAASYSPDGRHIVTADWEGHTRIWRTDRYTFKELPAHTGIVRHVAFSPDSRLVFTSGVDRTARVSDVESGALVTELRAHTGEVMFASFSPDSRYVATGKRGSYRTRLGRARRTSRRRTARPHRHGDIGGVQPRRWDGHDSERRRVRKTVGTAAGARTGTEARRRSDHCEFQPRWPQDSHGVPRQRCANLGSIDWSRHCRAPASPRCDGRNPYRDVQPGRHANPHENIS